MAIRLSVVFSVMLLAASCSQPEQEDVSSEATASSTAELGVPSSKVASDVSAVVTAIPEAEVSQSTVWPTLPSQEVLLRNGVPMVGWDLTVESAGVVDAAVEACSEVFVTSIMADCTAAVWEACYSARATSGVVYGAEGETNFREPEWNGGAGLGEIICDEAYSVEVVELAMVLAARYGDRYYSEDASLPFGEDLDYDLRDFQRDYETPARTFVLAEGVRRDFIDFRMYVGKKDWRSGRGNDVGSEQFISDEAQVRLDPLFEVIRDLRFAFSDFSSEPFEGFDTGRVIEFYAGRAIESDLGGSGFSWQGVDLSEDPEEIKLFCDEAAYAARVGMSNWENGLDYCVTVVESCVDKFVEGQSSICTNRLLYDVRQELMWKKLPMICAAVEDIDEESYSDSCRQSALDLHMLRIGPVADALRNHSDDRLQYHYTRSAFAEKVRDATFFLAQPLIADLPIQYRRIQSLPGP